MNDKDSNEGFSFIAIITRFFKKKKISFIKIKKKKKKKDFIVVKLPEKDVKENIVDENIDNKQIVIKKNVNESNVSKKNEDSKGEKVEPKATKERKKALKENFVEKKEEKKESNIIHNIYNFANSSNSSDETRDIMLEERILSSFESYLKEKNYLVKNYLDLYKEYNKEFDNALLYDDVQDVSLKIDDLLEKVNRLKDELQNLEKYIKKEGNLDIDDTYILYLLDEYKKEFNRDYDIKNLENISQKNKYKPIMVKLSEIDQVVNTLSTEVKEKKVRYADRDGDFEKLKEKFAESDENFDKIKFMVKENELLLQDLEYKVDNSKRVVNYVEKVFKRVNNNLDVLLVSYLAIKKDPLVPKTVKFVMATSLALESIKTLFASNVEYRSRSKIVIEDYEREIIDGLKSVDDIYKLIDSTMLSVVDMRREFKSKFSEYDLPEYKEVLDKLDLLSKNLDERRDYLKYTKEEFSLNLEKNKVKVKEMDYIPYDEDVNKVDDLK